MSPETSDDINEYASQIDDCVRENPTRSLAISFGIGLVLGLAIRSLHQPRASTHAVRLIEDLQERLHELTDRATDLAGHGVDRVRDLDLDRGVRTIGRRIRGLFH